MDVYDFALEFEIKHKNFYLKQAKESTNENLKKIFQDLAEEEEKHEQIVKKLAETKEVKELVESDLLPKVKEVFTAISANLPDNILPKEQVDIYKEAEEMERRSYEFYTEKAKKTSNEKIKEQLLSLAREEKKHERIMNNIVTLVDRPNTWLEDAEWYHLEEY